MSGTGPLHPAFRSRCAAVSPVPPRIIGSHKRQAALVDLIKQQALYPTDVNLRVSSPALGTVADVPGSALLRAISEEAQVNITAAQASTSFQFIQLLAELCGRVAAVGSGCQQGGLNTYALRMAPVGWAGQFAGGAHGSLGQAQGWRRLPVPEAATASPPLRAAPAPAPAMAMAAAASGRGPLPQLEATAMGAPAALVGFEPASDTAGLADRCVHVAQYGPPFLPAQLPHGDSVNFCPRPLGDWLVAQPAVLSCWDKVSLEPCGPPKAAQYYVVCGEQHSSAARMFIRASSGLQYHVKSPSFALFTPLALRHTGRIVTILAVQDVSATFLAMRLGTHTPGRTPAHLHSIDGVIPVPLDPGPGPPQAAATADGATAADATAAAATAPFSWHPLARRPDPSVVRSAILGFRSNHALASAASEPAWTPDEPSYRPGMAACTAAPAAKGGAAACGAGPWGTAAAAAARAPVPLCHYWRNLRHQQQQQHQDLGPAAAAVAGCKGVGLGSAAAGGGSSASIGPGDLPDVGPPALVVYVVPPSDCEEDVLRALMEVCACLAPVTPAARVPAAPTPLAAPPAPGLRDSVTAAAASRETLSHHHQQYMRLQQQHHKQKQDHAAQPSSNAAPGCHWVGEGCSGGSGGTAAPAASGSEAIAAAAAAASGGSAASTPPEPPAGYPVTASASSCSSVLPYGGVAPVSNDSADPALLARLGGAARHLYRTCPSVIGNHGSVSPQLDLSQLAAIDLTVQVVLPSSLHDVTGASVRATACAAYSKLCRRRAGYGAAAAGASAWSASSSSSSSSLTLSAGNTAAAAPVGCRDSGIGGGSNQSWADRCCVASSCSGRTVLYEPLVALAPLSLPASGDDDPAALPLPPPPSPPPPPPSLPPHQHGLPPPLHATRAGGASVSPLSAAEPAAIHQYGAGPAAGTVQAVTPPAPPPTLHGCYAWWRFPEASARAASCGPYTPAGAGTAQTSGGHFPQPPQQQERCWLAMAFCDAGGKLMDARAFALCFDAHAHKDRAAAVADVAATATSGSGGGTAPDGLSMQAAAQSSSSGPCNCKVDGGGGDGSRTGTGGSGDARQDCADPAGRFRSSGGDAIGDVGMVGPQLQSADREQQQPVQVMAQPVSLLPAPTAAATAAKATATAAAADSHASGEANSLDALVCRTVLGHAKLLSRQVAEAYSGDVSAAAAAGACTDGAVSPNGAVAASGTRGRSRAAMAPLALAKLGPPTAAEAAEWRLLLPYVPVVAGGGGSLRRRWDQAAAPVPSAASPAAAPVTLAWLEPHPSIAVQPGCRLPQGGFAVACSGCSSELPASAAAPQHSIPLPPPPPPPANPYAQPAAGEFRLPITLVAFPAQRPPSTTCAAAEALNHHLRLLSVHPWPRIPSPPPPPPIGAPLEAAAAGPAGGSEEGQRQGGPTQTTAKTAAVMNILKRPSGYSPALATSAGYDNGGGGGTASVVGPGNQGLGCQQHQQMQKRRRWGERSDGLAADGGPVGPAGCSADGGVSGAVGGWSDPGGSMLRELYGLCLLRDWLLTAQSGARGGPTPGRRQVAVTGSGSGGVGWGAAGVADADGDSGDAGWDAPLQLLPHHVAVCQQLLRMLWAWHASRFAVSREPEVTGAVSAW
ncbi:hypothetical protein VOLCADRAFT_90021 [Volvox carteri f. nagariensis]|uniref:Uncharacterized protein n=1 Tax=Volvox carteri f. nagariensis TaxID=3068 RepID=D8TTA2_VOLCA|nr:uncharacterized protein VOLCADRAFT_90021 [Volvox carteri f. nagariensis]EFJ49163.1 hypothetical protein VOLCADRAFT_90021 [Volvox carteri f. nagariensis]|eukprot:XP_002949611.1 hypothetical protein VOLCADRAFT_90021 [Volvox carteri f. nagariensis]